MNDWKKDLDNKFNMIKKEEENGQTISSAHISIRNNSGSSRNVHWVSVHKEINKTKEKGGKGMITVDGALKDLEEIEKEANDAGAKVVVKALKVVVKFLSTMRSNQLLTEDDKKRIATEKAKRQAAEKK
jgi:hypothetical protein